MWQILTEILSPEQYMPHGNCYLWQTSLVWLHAVSDTITALAYYSIPAMLLYFVKQREDVPFKWIFLLFSAFIISCGTTHILEVWTLWHPAYWLSGSVKAITALVSAYTAIELFPTIPQALAFPSKSDLEALNQELKNQIAERQAIEAEVRELNIFLENRVVERTAALAQANQKLEESQHFTQRIADFTPNILYIYDLDEQKNVYCNHFIREILGYSSEDFQAMGNNFLDNLLHPEDVNKVNKHLQRCRNLEEEEFWEVEYRIKDIQGKWHWLLSRDTIFERNKNGKAKQILGIAYDITERKNTELELQELNEQLIERVKELENRTQEMIKLGEMTDFLQACMSISEAEKAIADLLKPLFPSASGAVFRFDEERNLLEAVSSWGNFNPCNSLFPPNECWAIRRGSTHQGDIEFPGLLCQHIHRTSPPPTTLCVPMMAHGETLGVVYLSFEDKKELNKAKKGLVETVSKQIALAFANLQLQETLTNQSLRDVLTGLFNRRYLEEALKKEIQLAATQDEPLGVIMLDIDYFKSFNDTFGHDAGDAVLKEVSSFLQQNIRESDIACRYGGEELTVILPKTSLQTTIKRAEQIRQGIKQLKLYYQGKLLKTITASLGVASFPEHGITTDVLLKAADQALYLAKKQGRDRVVSSS